MKEKSPLQIYKALLQIYKTAFDKIKCTTLDIGLAADLEEVRSGINATHGLIPGKTPEDELYSPEATLYIVLTTGIESLRERHKIPPKAESNKVPAEPQPVRCKMCDTLQTSHYPYAATRICKACRDELEDPDTPFTM